MNNLGGALFALPEDLDLAQSLAEIFDPILPGCGVHTWQSLDELSIPVRTVAVFVTRAARISQTRDAVEKLNSGNVGYTVLVAGSELDAEQQLSVLAAGAADILAIPCRADELKARLYRAVGMLPANPVSFVRDPRLSKFIGNSAAFRKSLERLPMIAACDASVLLHGESGTGKEIFAQAIHYLSARASRPWVAVNCGAIPADLVESELFGHVRGAFTTAHIGRTGLVREAEGGTLFLDDIDCLPLDAQAKLLRFLQEREYRQVGSNAVMRADVRVIAASNQSLRKLAEQGAFRLDLYFRLDVLRLKLPPLRSRGADVAVLALHFVREFARELARPTTSISPAALQKLMAYHWPGNIRELRYVIERSVLLSRGTVLNVDDIELEDEGEGAESLSFRAAKTQVVERFERQLIQRLLITHEGNVARAARAAGKNRRAFFELMRKYSIDAAEYRNAPGTEPKSNVVPLRRDAPRRFAETPQQVIPAR